MRALAVVVLGVLIEDNPQVLFAEDEQPVQRFVSEGLDHALAMGVGSRSPIGREHNLGAFGPKDLVEVVDEFGVTIVDREPNPNVEPAQLPGQVARLLGHPRRVGMEAAVGVQDSTAVDLHEDQHVESPKQDRVDGEEVAGHDRSGMRLQELRPAGSLAARSWRHAVAAENASDCGRRTPVAQLEQLALDPAIAPPLVLAPEAEDQLSELLRERWVATARTVTEVGQMLTHQFAVPAEQGGRREHQPPGRQSQAQSGEDKAIGRNELRPLYLAAQNGHLMAESQDLEVALRVRAGRERCEADRQPQHHIDRRVEHEAGA